ncbi:MSEP-CTERM sorting domain-containing protein [Pontiellaceae bacterium B1224]|nr:MSEP-CTERM sorting domain-containing protein [Pontiellaceae bacterium B1224]
MKSFEKINPAIKANPLMILLTMVIPQLLLTLFRAHDLYLIREAIEEHHGLIHLNYLSFPLLLSALSLAMLFWSRHHKRDVPRLAMLGFFLLQTAGLVTFLMSLNDLIPDGVDEWIVPMGTFMMVQLASYMPGLFFGFICVANIRWFGNLAGNIGSSIGLLLFTPGALFVFVNAFPLWNLPETFVIAVFVITTLITAFAFLQLMLWLSGKVRGGWIATLVFALLFPLGGLALNHWIPFPADLQHWGFYALAIANGLILLWASLSSGKGNPFCAWMTAFSYPFTCYFFFLFLPFLPFSILAMIAIGSGFLILTPPILFVLHTRRLVLQFQTLETRFSKQKLIAGFLVAFLLVPVAYVGRALHHKQVFFQTLDRVYAAPINPSEPLPSPKVSAYALQKLKDSKAGIYIPILSETYNRIVFGGMVLPDRKIKQLEKLLLDETSNDWNEFDDFSFYSFFTDQSTRMSGRNVRPPSREVTLTDVTCTSEQSDGTIEATVLLTMQPHHNWGQAEYTQYITLPDGVFVSGYELKIGDEMVPARMSDRRAAMWVYHMIRDRARRDPGLVVYDRPNCLRLSVFPFAKEEERQCALRFLYPEGMTPSVSIGNEVVQLPGGQPASTLIQTAAGRQAVCIPAERAQQMPGVFRTLEKIELTGTDATPGYCPEWDVKRALLDYWNSGDEQLETVPWFITETEQPVVEFDRADWWLPLIPDSGWSTIMSGKIEVLPIQCGEQVRVIPKQRGGVAVFDSSDTTDFSADAQLGADSRYAKAIDLWQDWWQTQLHPDQEDALRKELLLAAREINILIPSTAFLAVESDAQKKALKEAENKSLKSNKALGFDEFEEEPIDSPEPGLLMLMLLTLPIIHWWQDRRNRNA